MHTITRRALPLLALFACPLALPAQDKPAPKPDTPTAERHAPADWNQSIPDCRLQATRPQAYDCEQARYHTYTIFLRNAVLQNDANEILAVLRNMFDPTLKVFLLSSQNAIVVGTYPEEFARIDALVKTLDIPHKTFRLTYTITDLDNGRPVGTQHFTMQVADGHRDTLKQGSKIPVATGSYADSKGSPGALQTQFTYLDVGINIDATPTAAADHMHLRAKIEQSSVAADPVIIAGVAEPIIRQSVLDAETDLPLGKPVILGSLDVTGTTHHLDIAVLAEPLP